MPEMTTNGRDCTYTEYGMFGMKRGPVYSSTRTPNTNTNHPKEEPQIVGGIRVWKEPLFRIMSGDL